MFNRTRNNDADDTDFQGVNLRDAARREGKTPEGRILQRAREAAKQHPPRGHRDAASTVKTRDDR